MSGYRDRSSFDPNAGGGAYGAPLRPYSWVQWLGVAFIVAGLAITLAVLTGVARVSHNYFPAFTLMPLMGSVLINSRREEVSAEDMAERRRRSLVAFAATLLICGIFAAAIFYFKGA